MWFLCFCYFFICGLICGVCFVVVCSPSFILLVPQEDWVSWLWHFVGIFTYPVSWKLRLMNFACCRVCESMRLYKITSIDIVYMFWYITKTCLYIFYPLKPHFFIVKLGFIGYTLFFTFLLKNIDCGYSLEPPRRGGSNEYPHLCFEQKHEKYRNFLYEKFHFFFGGKIFVYLNRHVFVMHLGSLS